MSCTVLYGCVGVALIHLHRWPFGATSTSHVELLPEHWPRLWQVLATLRNTISAGLREHKPELKHDTCGRGEGKVISGSMIAVCTSLGHRVLPAFACPERHQTRWLESMLPHCSNRHARTHMCIHTSACMLFPLAGTFEFPCRSRGRPQAGMNHLARPVAAAYQV